MSEQPDILGDLLRRTAAEARDAGRLVEAERLYLQALELSPTSAETAHHLAGVRYRLGRFADAETAYRRAVELAPGALGTWRVLATLLLSQGRYAEGFPLFEARHELPGMTKPELPFPEWTGEEVAGKKLLIWPEQGLGDQIQFARFAPILKARGAAVTLLCAPPLARLFAGCLGVRVAPASGAVEFDDPDYWVMTMSLAWRAGVTPETVPGAPYLRALDPAPQLPAGFKAGLTTKGSAAHANDAARSLSADAAALLQAAPAQIVSLDPAETGAADFADTAAIIQGLDLVICVDTAVAHLAGAMGKPCWVMLPSANTDWRWLRDRTDSPWYPSIRLYRQEEGEDWMRVAQRVCADLAQLTEPVYPD